MRDRFLNWPVVSLLPSMVASDVFLQDMIWLPLGRGFAAITRRSLGPEAKSSRL